MARLCSTYPKITKKNLREAYTNNVEQNGKESPADSANQKITYI